MRLCVLLPAMLALFAASAAAMEPAAPEMFGALPTVSQCEISPDGATLAQVQSKDSVRAIAFYDLTGEKAPIGVELGDVKARDLRWAGPDHVIALISASETFAWGNGLETHEIWRWISVDRTKANFSYMFSGANIFNFYFYPGWPYSLLPDDPGKILMSHANRYGAFSLYEVRLDNGAEKLVQAGEAETDDWVVDAHGAPIVRIDYDQQDEERRFFKPADNRKGWTQASFVKETPADDVKIVLHAPADSHSLIYATSDLNGYLGLRVFDIDSGSVTRTAFSHPRYDTGEPMFEANTGALVGVNYTDDFLRTKFIDPALAKVQADLERALPNAAPKITSWSADRTKFMVRVLYADHPEQFFLYDIVKRSLAMMSASYEALDGKIAAVKEKFDYVASDGMQIAGYLTVPAGAVKRGMPLVVLPHGGPWARDDQAFDWWSFFYAARGYLVYQPNFRGSTGYGTAYKEAGYGEWGRKMQDDITNGVKYLVADGIADPQRICIVGGSYGGYAALAGATLTPDLYACAVSVNGVSNLGSMIAYQTDRGRVEEDAWDLRIGKRVQGAEELRAVSPAYQAANARAPVLLIHAKDDTVVPIGQSRIMFDALKKARKPVEFVELDGEDHWLSSGATRTEMLARSIEFIDRHIGAATIAAAP